MNNIFYTILTSNALYAALTGITAVCAIVVWRRVLRAPQAARTEQLVVAVLVTIVPITTAFVWLT